MSKDALSNADMPKAAHSLSRTLILWFMLLAMLPMIIVSWISYQQAHQSLSLAAHEKLVQSAVTKIAFINNWFTYRVMDLKNQAADPYNVALLMDLHDSFQKSDSNAEKYFASDAWIKQVNNPQNNLKTMSRIYDYIYDLFLIDMDGNILYSVAGESDLGSNLFRAPLANSLFAKSVTQTLQTGEVSFSDIERYSPSGELLAGFLTAPVLDKYQNIIGIFAIQIRLDKLFQRISEFDNFSKNTLTHYLIGTDNLLRSSINGISKDVLNRSIDTVQSQQWQSEVKLLDRLQKHNLPKELQKQKHTHNIPFTYLGPSGREVIGLHQILQTPGGNNWALISEVNYDEALAPANWLGKVTLFLVLLTGLLAALIAFFQARRITQPIIRLAEASKLVAKGELDQRVELNINNEIGQLAESFNNMIVMRQCHERLLKQREHEAHKALKALNEQQFALNQHAIVEITDIQGNIIFVNERFCDISGYTEEELLGKNNRIFNSGKQEKSFWVDMFRTISNGNVFNAEICNRSKTGHEYWVDTTIVPFFGDDNSSSRYISIRTDITKIKQTELFLKEAKEAAESANSAKSEFLANMSHEIRTPMNGVIGMTNLLLGTSLNETQHTFAKTVKNSAESLLAIINDILDFSKVEAGMLDMESIEFDMSLVMHDFGRSIAYRAHDKDLELICPADPIQHHWFNSDPGRIRQILNNLVSNAIKFTHQGEVAVHYRLLEQTASHSRLKFEITDTGIGLNDEQLDGLFERFNQADGSTTRKYGGTGLGLAISKQLVELMGGEIGVKSKEGQGSTFWFTLLLDNVTPKTIIPSLDLHEQKILVVDDNLTNRMLLDQLLISWQVKHTVVESGAIALKVLLQAENEGSPYDIAIVDMQMPEMDGIQLGNLIKNDKRLSATHLLMLTSQGTRGDAEKFQQAGFDAYLNKPIDQSVLYNSLLKVSGLSNNNDSLITAYNAHQEIQFKARILVVEDNTTNQLVAQCILEEFGIQPDMATNGAEAIHALETLPYDLVFMDCQMPVMDGYEATRHIRSPQSKVLNKSIPIIAMTANAMQGDREKCLAVGMDDFISKPIESHKILHTLKDWLADFEISDNKRVASDIAVESPKKTLTSTPELIFDYAAMSNRLMNNETLIRKVIETFSTDMEMQINLLKAAIENNDFTSISAQAHKIKGSSANVSAIVLSNLAEAVEEACKTKEIKTLHEILAEIENNFALLKNVMEEYL